LDLFFDPEDEGNVLLAKRRLTWTDYTALYRRRQSSSQNTSSDFKNNCRKFSGFMLLLGNNIPEIYKILIWKITVVEGGHAVA
jgi:hypothetical protein